MSQRDFPDDLDTVALPKVERLPLLGEAFVLEVIEGPDLGRRFALDTSQPPRMLVGQSPVCDLRLADGQVSRRHVALELSEGTLRLVDLGSTNGTTVNGVSVGQAYLRGGEIIRMGGTAVRVSLAVPPSGASLSQADHFGRLLGSSPAMRRLYPICERLAASDVPVLIEGETGSGKELLAEALHETGRRAAGPFVVFDCTAVAPNLLEAALFGHEKGSFTGATEMRRGVFEQADGGTLLIDEIGDLDLALQPKLLRCLERSEVRRVGGDRVIRVNVRVLAATRRDLDQEIQAGRFRDDLFFRLAVARVELAPLRARRPDIPVLARHFWEELGGGGPLPADLLKKFETYSWPGNVRELRNAIARHLALGDLAQDDQGNSEAYAPKSGEGNSGEVPWADQILAQDLPFPRARQRILEEFQGRYVARVLEKHGGHVSRAAAASGIARRYFQILKARQTKG